MPGVKALAATLACGIYGFQVTRPIDLAGPRIQPRTNDYEQAKRWARDLDSYHLTAVLTGETMSDELLFNLEAVLSFIEHLDVVVTSPSSQTDGDLFAQFSPVIRTHRRSSGGGAVIGEDTFFRTSRALFISKALDRLQDQAFCDKTHFKTLFFKCVETFRQRKQFVDVSYFLLFSGLESYTRAVLNDRLTRNAAEPICKLLKRYGFDVDVERPHDLPRAVSTYTRLRNTLFHNSEFTAKTNVKGLPVELEVSSNGV